MHTNYPDISAAWKAHLDDRHYIQIFIWGKKAEANEFLWDAIAASRPSLRVIGPGKGNKPDEICIPKKFAEVHLWKGKYDAEVVAHELMHVMCFWVEAWGLDVVEDNEAIANAAGKLAAEFWRWHYAVTEEESDDE